MGNRAATVRQVEITRAVKGCKAGGMVPGKVVVAPDGTVTVYPAGMANDSEVGPNPWDEVDK